ncbi:DUF2255 family protein [Streptosporangium canum]|uniref:DUF2255 family protein n=1 Tax=Streptosporangium canum TaxID=324952 RepID=A0A1I3H4N3_9ACTN|nr:DUF2255 family protein [Streptosporangium canum]SFI30664.1 hypothetical protein SAMN05216275_102352 [Streptosporangium canum]
MTTWTSDALTAIGGADELRITPLRGDGTRHAPVPIWVVRDGDDLYVRSYRGDGGAWYRAASRSHRARIDSGGVHADVDLLPETDPDRNQRIDTAYRTKYQRYGAAYVDPMTADQAKATTLRLLPHDAT